MLVWMLVKVGVKALWANKLRSFLAVLGLTIGVGSVIAMLGLGAGTQKAILDRMSSLGTNLLYIMPNRIRQEGRDTGALRRLRLEDALFIAENVEGLAYVTPLVRGTAQFKYSNKNSQATFYGSANTYFVMRNLEVEHGRPFTASEGDARARVVVIGSQLATDLFGDAPSAVDQSIKIKGLEFEVVGVLKTKGESFGGNPDEQGYMPYSTAMKQLLGTLYLQEIDAQVAEGADPYEVTERLTAMLRKEHKLTASQEDDFRIRNQEEMLDTVKSMTDSFQMLLGGIAAISLLVGGIGIMNVMLVTVTERTREIGIRKAIGARNHDILGQFLFESVLVSGLGGGLGVVLAYGGGAFTKWYFAGVSTGTPMSMNIVIEPYFVWLSFGVATAVGIFFGFYPAWRASSLDPIEALRYE